jgi:hypothetical protein
MGRPTIVLIHGMGEHTAPKSSTNERGSFGKECIDSFNDAFAMYPSLDTSNIEEHSNFVEIHYNHIFDRIRQSMAENGQTISDLLKGAGAMTALGSIPGLVQSVVSFEASLGGDSERYTHWLDVLLYKLYFGEEVRVHVARKLGDVVAKNSSLDIHILAHSLGTAVIHDTLSKIYSFEYSGDDEIADLSPTTHKLASLWQVSNVSRLANSVLKIADPYRSLVRPGAKGVTSTMMNIHHKLDPIALIKKYSRSNNGRWIPKNIYKTSYLDIETSDITDMNTHSIKQYLHDPAVHLYLFKQLGIPVPRLKERQDAFAEYKSNTIAGANNKIKKKLEKLRTGNSATFNDYMKAVKMQVELLKEQGQ